MLRSKLDHAMRYGYDPYPRQLPKEEIAPIKGYVKHIQKKKRSKRKSRAKK